VVNHIVDLDLRHGALFLSLAREMNPQEFMRLGYTWKAGPVSDPMQDRFRRSSLVNTPSPLERLKTPHFVQQVVGQVARFAADAVARITAATTQLVVLELNEPVVREWLASGIKQGVLPARPLTDQGQVEMPQGPHAIEIEQGAKVAAR
jgi:hypothetical protein